PAPPRSGSRRPARPRADRARRSGVRDGSWGCRNLRSGAPVTNAGPRVRWRGDAPDCRCCEVDSHDQDWICSPFPAAEDGGVDPTATFIKRFGDLVTLLRVDPGNDAAQDLALSAAAAAVQSASIELEAGIAWAQIPDDMPLKARMLARQV